MRIVLATDAWEPQVNGVVRTLTRTVAECRGMGHEVEVIEPSQFKTIPCPTYPEIRLALGAEEEIRERLRAFEPEAVHIATEGPIGIAMRRICVEWKLPFTTSYHTKFPEYVSARFPIPVQVGYAYMKWFHKPSGRLMVATPTLRDELVAHGFKNVSPWTRGVDTEQFKPRPGADLRLSRRQGLAAAVLPQRRPGGGREEHRGLPRNRPAGDQDRRRRRAGPGRPGRPLSERQIPRRPLRRGAGALLPRRRRLRLPVLDRHLRPGDPGGHGGWNAGRGLSRRTVPSTSSRAPTPAPSTRT
jgi:hypothetical protein